jgi:hypothetical protein
MALRDRLNKSGAHSVVSLRAYGEAAAPKPTAYQEIKARLHSMLIDRMDLSQLNLLTPQETHAQVARIANTLLTEEDLLLSLADRERLIEESDTTRKAGGLMSVSVSKTLDRLNDGDLEQVKAPKPI